MPFYIVQPWGHDRYRQATVQSIQHTIDDAYARLDAIAEKLLRDGAPADYLELPVVKAPLHSTGAASRLDDVAPRSQMPNLLPRRALPAERIAGLG